MHDGMPDFIVRLKTNPPIHLTLETKGFDDREEVKRAYERTIRPSLCPVISVALLWFRRQFLNGR
jgi:hypothetical protein